MNTTLPTIGKTVLLKNKIAALHIGPKAFPVIVTQEIHHEGTIGVVAQCRRGMWGLLQGLLEMQDRENVSYSGDIPQMPECITVGDWLVTVDKGNGYMEVYPELVGNERILTVVWGGTRASIFSGPIRLGNSL